MGIRELFGFSRAGAEQVGEENPPPSTAKLAQEQAVDELMGLFDSVPDPDWVLHKLGLPRECLRQLESDDEISGALETRHDAVVSTPWRLEPDTGPVAQWVLDEIGPHIEDVISGAWSALPYGYSVQEVIWRPDPQDRNRVGGVEAVVSKPFEWFKPTRDGELRYLRPDNQIEGERVDAVYKFLLTCHRASWRNPYGEALLSRLYWPWFFRNQGWRFWMQFLERHGTPLMLGKGSNPDGLAEALSRAVQDSVVAVGQDDNVEAVGSQQSGESFDRVEQALVRRIQRRILGQTLTSGTDGTGSRALGEVHDRVRMDKRDADIRLVQPTVQQLITAGVFLRFGPNAEAPEFRLEDGQGLQTQRAERDEKLFKVGVRFTEDYIQRTYGLEADEFSVSDNPGGQSGGGGLGLSASSGSQGVALPPGAQTFAQEGEGRRFTAAQEEVETIVGSTLAQSPNPIDPEELRGIIRASSGPEDLSERLAARFDAQRLGGSRQFRELVERALFAADIVGFGQAQADPTDDRAAEGDE